MSDANNTTYEDIVVIAVYMPNAEEISFEENYGYILEQYRKFLNGCAKIMQGNNCRDIMLFNNHIYGIYERKHNRTGRDLETTGIGISRLARDLNCRTEGYYAERLLCGIGIAMGTAVKIMIQGPFGQSGMWTGRVFNKAYSMAQMSVCDGMQRVFMDDTIESYFYR